MRRFWPLAVLVAILIAIVLLPQWQQQTIRPTLPKRIISLAPSITEMAYAIGLGPSMVAVTDYDQYPPAAQKLAKVGGYTDPNLEKILSLKPDLVILLSTAQSTNNQLLHLGIATLLVNNTTLDGIKNSIQLIGQASGHQQQAQQLLHSMQQQIDSISTKTTGLNKPRVMISIAHYANTEQLDTIYIAGQRDFYNDLITLAGGQNVYQNRQIKVPSLSAEGILKLNPDIIIDLFPDKSAYPADLGLVKRQWQSLSALKAIKQGNLHIIEGSYTSIPGPRITQLLLTLAQLIHPELDWQQHDDTN